MSQYLSLQVDTPEIHELVRSLCPALRNVSYEDLEGNTIVLGYPSTGKFTIMLEHQIQQKFDYLNNYKTISLTLLSE